MASVKRGKALVASLRAQPGVRDPEALAAYLGRFKKARKAGKSVAKARAAAGGGDSTKRDPGVSNRRIISAWDMKFEPHYQDLLARKRAKAGGSDAEIRADRHANLKKGDKVHVEGVGQGTVTSKTRDGKIKVQPESGREAVHDPAKVHPESRNGRTLNPRGSTEGQKPGDPGYRGKNDPRRERRKK